MEPQSYTFRERLQRLIKNSLTYLKNTRIRVYLSVVVLLFILVIPTTTAPRSFPLNSLISIEKGMTLKEVSVYLEEENVIRSPFLFKNIIRLTKGQGSVISGEYSLYRREGVFTLARRVTEGDYGLELVKITLPEGATIEEMGAIFSGVFSKFDREAFEMLAEGKEGYLFPDTYYFLPNVGALRVYETLSDNFYLRVEEVEGEVQDSGYTLHEIITMASLLEEEARTEETRRIISGILWERLRIGMALQVDAVFPYIIGKNTFEISLDDLKVDSPYNTYKYRGLPPGAISNPGMISIRAALNPTPSPYLFYLSDREGVMHYAEDFDQHRVNKAKYLR